MASAATSMEIGEFGFAPPVHVRPVDLKHLRRYTLGDRGLEQEVLDLFLDQAPVSLEILRTAQTVKTWHDAAHALKGSCRAVGAWGMARLAEQAERFTNLTDRDSCGLVVLRLEEALTEVRNFLDGR